MSSLEMRSPRGGLTTLFSFLRRGHVEGGAGLCSVVTSDRTHGIVTKLYQGSFRLNIRKKIITVRMVKHWNRLPSKVVVAPCLSVVKRHLDNALNTML